MAGSAEVVELFHLLDTLRPCRLIIGASFDGFYGDVCVGGLEAADIIVDAAAKLYGEVLPVGLRHWGDALRESPSLKEK